MPIVLKRITSALQQIGYTPGMLVDDVSFVQEGGKLHKANLVAYASELRKDVDTAVIAVKKTSDIQEISYDEIKPFKALATPIVVFAEYQKQLRNDEPLVRTVGLCEDSRSFNRQSKKDNIVPVSRFEQYLKDKREQFSPRKLETAKRRAEQLTIFDVCPDLLQQAFKITKVTLVDRFESGIQKILLQHPKVRHQKIMQASIQFLGARILRDRLRKTWPLTNVGDFLNEAELFLPTYFKLSSESIKLIAPLLDSLHAGYDLSQISIDMVGEFYETFNVNETIRKQFGIHYTNSGLAKSLLKRMPIEEISPDRRMLWDPTCGSGNLLAAGYERLATAEYANVSPKKRHQKLVNTIFGNDRDVIAVMIAKMTLMLFHPPHSNNWKISNYDVEKDDISSKTVNYIGNRPTIIVANPPFGGVGSGSDQDNVKRPKGQRDRSAFILSRCLDVLPKDGLMGIILTETILDQQQERDIRRRVIQQCQILEQWAVPAKWFKGVNRSALVWIIRKRPPIRNKVFIFPISNVPAPWITPMSQGVLHININKPIEKFVPSPFETILSKMEAIPHVVNDYFKIMNGFRKPALLAQEKIAGAYLYSGNAKRTHPYVDLRRSGNDWVMLTSPDKYDKNFDKKNQREALRKQLLQKSPSVLLRASRNTHGSSENINWSSIALIDVPPKKEQPIAPSESYHAIFPKVSSIHERIKYSYALWAIFNHPLASLFFHERQRIQWISTKTVSNFPLPQDWDIHHIELLTRHAEQLIAAVRSIPIDDALIAKLVNDLDELIYCFYGITDTERQQIENKFEEGTRPGLKGIFSFSKNRLKKIRKSPAIKIDFNKGTHTTTCETIEVLGEAQRIRLAIDGLTTYMDNEQPAINGILLKIMPDVMPGWLLHDGATGLIELSTWDVNKLKKHPEKYIIDFSLMKNAYMRHDEIERELTAILDQSAEEANID